MNEAIVRLRPIVEEDLPILFEHQRDPDANIMAAFPARPREAFMTHWSKILKGSGNLIRAIVFEQRLAGNILSWDSSDERDLGYWLGRDFWGRGIATGALKQFLSIDTTRPLHAHVAEHNLASQRVLEKCGFLRVREELVPESGLGGAVREFIFRLD